MANMTVGDLLEALRGQDPTLEVWLSKDEEGNGFAPVPKSEGYGFAQVIPTDWGWTDEILPPGEKRPDAVDVVILWPDA